MPKGFVFCVAIGLSLLIFAGKGVAANSDFTIETLNGSIESQEGEKLRVAFATEGQPALLFRPDRGAWEWSGTSKLFIPLENPGDEPLTLLLRIESAPGRLLSGKVAMAPRRAGDLAIWLDAPAPRAMGMIAGPSLKAAGLEPQTLPVTATEGEIDTSRVTSVRLGISRPAAPSRLSVGPLRVEPPSQADRAAYDGIVDAFGQFRPGTWPEKVNSAEMLRARGAEEAKELDWWRPDASKRDRFGGLLGSRGFRATGFFHTEQRAGRWWLVTPAGNPFFSIGIDAVAASGATYVDGREFMFRDLPPQDGELAAHWNEQDDRRGLGSQRGRSFDHGRAFNFYTANLERKFGVEWRVHWREKALARLEAWGFNTIGNWSDPDLWAMQRLPYAAPLSPEGEYAKVSSGEDWWGPMPDPFDPSFAEAADKMARNAAARFRGDPYLIGYFVDNELSWGQGSPTHPQEYYALAITALAAGPESPVKSAFVAHLTETYREPDGWERPGTYHRPPGMRCAAPGSRCLDRPSTIPR